MPRKPRITLPGFYHVISRGVERRNVYLEDEDFEQFLEILLYVKKNYNIIVHAFCLMSNHYHLLLQIDQSNISEAMRYLNSQYSAWFNRKYKRSGHLWQGRFKSYYLYDEAHFWTVTKYIERNPVAAGIVKKIDQYQFQSLYQWQKADKYASLLDDSKIIGMKLQEYEIFVDFELNNDELNFVYKSPKILLSDDGAFTVLNRRLNYFFEASEALSRNQKVVNAAEYGYSQTEIAQYIGMSVTSVSKILRGENAKS